MASALIGACARATAGLQRGYEWYLRVSDYSIQFLIFPIYIYHGTHVMCDNWNELSHLACATVYPRLPGVRLPLDIKKIQIKRTLAAVMLGPRIGHRVGNDGAEVIG